MGAFSKDGMMPPVVCNNYITEMIKRQHTFHQAEIGNTASRFGVVSTKYGNRPGCV